MRNKKFKMLTLLLVLSTTIMLGGVKSYAYLSHITGSVDGTGVYAGCTALMYSASATTTGTSPNSGIDATVISTYNYVNMYTGISDEQGKYQNGPNGVTVSFSSPEDCRTVNILSTHYASKNGSDWNQITLQTYPNTIS
jgi:hypothetical protein